jgi:hypothetical protein
MTAVSSDGNLAVYGEVIFSSDPEIAHQDRVEKVVTAPARNPIVYLPAKPAAPAAAPVSAPPKPAPVVAEDEATITARRMRELGSRPSDTDSGSTLAAVATPSSLAPTIVQAGKTEEVAPNSNAMQAPYAYAKSLDGVERNPAPVEVPILAAPAVPSTEHAVLDGSPVSAPAEVMDDWKDTWLGQIVTQAMARPTVAGVPYQPVPVQRSSLNPVPPPIPVITPLTPDNKWPTAYGTNPLESGPALGSSTMHAPVVATNSAPVLEPTPILNPIVSSMAMPMPKGRTTLEEPPAATASSGQLLTTSEMRPMPTGPAVEHNPALAPVHETAMSPESGRIKHEIEAQCGHAVSRVQMFNQADHTVLMRIFLSDPAVEKAVTDKLLQIPDVMKPGVKMELLIPE